LRSEALVTSLSSILLPQHDPLTHKHLLRSLTLGRAREYFRATCTLAPFSLAPTSFNTTLTFTTLHFKSNDHFPFSLEDYELDQDFKLSFSSFKLTFQHMPHLSTSGHVGMVFELFWDCFHLENLVNGFFQLFQLCFISHMVTFHPKLHMSLEWPTS
jgi:hypothetical protein